MPDSLASLACRVGLEPGAARVLMDALRERGLWRVRPGVAGDPSGSTACDSAGPRVVLEAVLRFAQLDEDALERWICELAELMVASLEPGPLADAWRDALAAKQTFIAGEKRWSEVHGHISRALSAANDALDTYEDEFELRDPRYWDDERWKALESSADPVLRACRRLDRLTEDLGEHAWHQARCVAKLTGQADQPDYWRDRLAEALRLA